MTLPILTLFLPDVAVATRQDFLTFIGQYVHTFALQRQDDFIKAQCDAEYFHKDKQRTEKKPKLIHSLMLENQLALRAYTPLGIETLKFWFELFSKAHPEFCKNSLLKNETCSIEQSQKKHLYSSTNWIPYRKCSYKHGFYYNEAVHEVANFHNTLLGNLRTFLNLLGFDNTLRFNLSLKTLKKHRPVVALLDQKKDIVKNAFSVVVETDLTLPSIFSLGQNVGYGNGVFFKK